MFYFNCTYLVDFVPQITKFVYKKALIPTFDTSFCTTKLPLFDLQN